MIKKSAKPLPIEAAEMHELIDWQPLKLFFMNHKAKKITLELTKEPKTIKLKWRVK